MEVASEQNALHIAANNRDFFQFLGLEIDHEIAIEFVFRCWQKQSKINNIGKKIDILWDLRDEFLAIRISDNGYEFDCWEFDNF
eukprot:CAMPEP_0171380638 /NCGR_PEP_ID=MMETSP0879-20121228/29776_1 /TAXON_ID=67004 /ORGANISM="Thalassiosira weissflogii, Strain CCMP1336" /LENGTH=83 /DNA_ID=CAMNT_0011891823 /DNA_START=170 /DNA_END=421 /DNA_ORIENTATION=+